MGGYSSPAIASCLIYFIMLSYIKVKMAIVKYLYIEYYETCGKGGYK